MALIKCPECGKEISDKSKACIYCGYPLDELADNTENKSYKLVLVAVDRTSGNLLNITNKLRELMPGRDNKELIAIVVDRFKFHILKDGLTHSEAEVLKHELYSMSMYTEIIPSESDIDVLKNIQLRCPRCASTQVTIGIRGFSLLTGFVGSNKTINRCGKCGHTWKPKA